MITFSMMSGLNLNVEKNILVKVYGRTFPLVAPLPAAIQL